MMHNKSARKSNHQTLYNIEKKGLYNARLLSYDKNTKYLPFTVQTLVK